MSNKNKLNARRRCASISLSLLHTQGVQTLTTQKTRNEPNFHPATPFMQNEPNPSPANRQKPKAKSCFLRNEPNSSPLDEMLTTKGYMLYAAFNKTNPIYPTPTICRPLFTQNEPNPSPLDEILTTKGYMLYAAFNETNPISAGQQPIANSQKLLFTKRTQFTPPPPSAAPGLRRTTPIPARWTKC